MEREILFKAKRKDNAEWVYGYYLVKAEKHIIWSRGDIRYYQVIPETVGQFTGLTDKNGNKIFEGDIVSYLGTSFTYRVIFEKGGFYLKHLKHQYLDNWGPINRIYELSMEVEITGNIHDKI